MNDNNSKKKKFARIIIGYPFALIVISLLANTLLFGVAPAAIALPVEGVILALTLSTVLLLANHTWLMTSTELTRLTYNMHATPEEWATSAHQKADTPAEGVQELDRRHNAHNNATENIVYFALFALLISFVTPTTIAAQVWLMGFALGRLGHTFSYLTGRDGLRGISMSVSLASLYGLASYLLVSLCL